MQSNRPKPVLAISSCLLGENVRYDGSNKRDSNIIDALGDIFSFLPVCPEVAIGLGVPREPIQMVRIKNDIRLRGRIEVERDFTDAMQAYIREFLEQSSAISGYIFKSKSPSCGLSSVPVFNPHSEVIDYSTGIFANGIMSANRELPAIDEQLLMEPGQTEVFIQKVMVYQRHNTIIVDQ